MVELVSRKKTKILYGSAGEGLIGRQNL